MLKKPFRLTKARDFKLLGVKGRSVYGSFLVMRVRTVPAGEGPKVAFITSTKVFKKAVDRNRIKRRLRALMQGLLLEIPKNIHLLFIVRQEALPASHANLTAELKRLLAKIPEALTQPPRLSPRAKKMGEQKAGRPVGK